ncbi:MAG: hypothetical protein ABI664_07485 [bacterium]
MRSPSAILLGRRRNAVRRCVWRITSSLGVEFRTRFDEFAREKPLERHTTALSDAIAFLGWLRRNRILPTDLRFLAVKLRWRQLTRR